VSIHRRRKGKIRATDGVVAKHQVPMGVPSHPHQSYAHAVYMKGAANWHGATHHFLQGSHGTHFDPKHHDPTKKPHLARRRTTGPVRQPGGA
jgi:hypothetical protein